MREYTVRLPDDTAHRLSEYASERHQSQEEAIVALIVGDLLQAEQQTKQEVPIGVNPLEKYVGRWVARQPELSHDEFLAREALGEAADDATK